MSTKRFDGLINHSLTVSVEASLPSIHAELAMTHGTILARVHPICNRQFEDENVVARGLVYLPEDEIYQPYGLTGLRRLTIHAESLEFDSQDLADYLAGLADEHMLERWRQTRNNYWLCMERLLAVPTVNLHDPMRSMRSVR